MAQKRTPPPLTVSDDEIQLPSGSIGLGEEVYAHNASTQPNGSEGSALISANPLEADITTGEAMYVTADSSEIFQFYCSTPYDFSTASLISETDFGDTEPTLTDMAWSNDGQKLYTLGSWYRNVYEYDCSTPFNVTTATLSVTFDVSNESIGPNSMAWNNDGSKLYIAGRSYASVHEYDCETTFDLTTAELSVTLDVSSEISNLAGIAWNSDGSKLYMTGDYSLNAYEYDLSTAFDISTASLSETLDIDSGNFNPVGVAWNNDGSKLYVPSSAGDYIDEYVLSTPFDLTTATFQSSFDPSVSITSTSGMVWSDP